MEIGQILGGVSSPPQSPFVGLRTKRIYVCSPLRGAVERNIIRANLYSRFVSEKGHLPLAPHAIFTQFLDDEKKSERQAGMALGMELLKLCDELWVFGLEHSDGMKKEIAEAKKLNIIIRYFTAEMEEQ